MRLRGRLPTTQHGRSRALLLRLLAVLTGCLPLLAAELACHLLGLGTTATDSDPFVGFAGSRPLFELSDDRSAYRISAALVCLISTAAGTAGSAAVRSRHLHFLRRSE